VVFPEVYIPGTPIWIDSRPMWDGDEDWYAMLVDQAVVVPGPVTEALGAAARAVGSYVVIGV
jgi:nitrilase